MAILLDDQFGGYTVGSMPVRQDQPDLHPVWRFYDPNRDIGYNGQAYGGNGDAALYAIDPSANPCSTADNVISDGRYGRTGRIGTPGKPRYWRLVSHDDFTRPFKVNFDFSPRWYDFLGDSPGARLGIHAHIGHQNPDANYVIGLYVEEGTCAIVRENDWASPQYETVANAYLDGGFKWGGCYRLHIDWGSTGLIRLWVNYEGQQAAYCEGIDNHFTYGQVGVRADYMDAWINGFRVYT